MLAPETEGALLVDGVPAVGAEALEGTRVLANDGDEGVVAD